MSALAMKVASPTELSKDPTMTQLMMDHPLYPLLQIVFQKCELATCSPRDSQAEAIASSESVGEDIRNFINESRLRNIPLTTGVPEVDKFMLKAIEVLRIHLLELEKVHQLCDNFCQRYINCLKGKLPIDLVVEDGSSRDTNSTSRNGNQHDGGPSSNNSSSNNNNNNSTNNQNNSSTTTSTQNGQSTNDHQNQHNNSQHSQQHNGHHNSNNHHHHHQNNNHHHPQHHPQDNLGSNGYGHDAAAAAAYHQSYGAFGPAGYGAQNPYAAHHAAYAAGSAAAAAAAAGMPHYQVPGDHHSASMKHEPMQANHHHRDLTASSGSSSASSVKMEHGGPNGGQYGAETNSATTAPDRQMHDDVRSPTGSTGSFLGDASLGSGDGTEEDDDNRGRRQQKKRGIFPKAATNIMRAWLFQHLNHPYPSEDQKKQLAEETGLTILQVNNWFINARRRIVQPMIDQSNRTSGMSGPAFSPDAYGGYGGHDPAAASMGGAAALASHAAMTSAAMGAYSAASAQHQLSQYSRQQQHMFGLATPPTAATPLMMGPHPTALPPHDYDYYCSCSNCNKIRITK